MSSTLLTLGCVGPGQNMDGGPPSSDTADMAHAPDGGSLSPQWLTLPFRRGTKFAITEGWVYSDMEKMIHGDEVHFATDFAPQNERGEWAPGTPVVAMHDGWAVQFFHINPDKRNVTLPDGRACAVIGNGFGHGVQIWNPKRNIATGHGHLQKAADHIPKLTSTLREEDGLKFWDPNELYVDPSTLVSRAVWVKRGEVIGYVGASGLSCDFEEGPDTDPNESLKHAWDEPHVHVDAYRRGEGGSKAKGQRWDLFDLYSRAPAYVDLKPGPKGLWFLNTQGTPAFAEEVK